MRVMKKAVIFDLDGTLLDTLEDLADSVNYVLKENGFPERSLEEIKSFVGNGMKKLMSRSAPQGTASEKVEEMFRLLVTYYQSHCQIKTRPYAGIPELLKNLRAQGFLTAVISNKADEAVQDLVRQMFPGCFDFALGGSDGVKLKPDRAMVDIALKKLLVDASEAFYVGDSEVDLDTARNAEMDCISVTWGFRTRDVLIANGARMLADTPMEVMAFMTPYIRAD